MKPYTPDEIALAKVLFKVAWIGSMNTPWDKTYQCVRDAFCREARAALRWFNRKYMRVSASARSLLRDIQEFERKSRKVRIMATKKGGGK